MKRIILFTAITFFALISCDPIEDRDVLPSLEQPEKLAEKIHLTVENTFPGGNLIALSVDDGYQIRWSAKDINSFKNRDTIKLRLIGEHEIVCDVLTKGGIVSISRVVEVDSIPDLVEEPLAFLIDYFGEGKTWVYATDFGDGTLHWYLSAPYAWDEIWWLPISEGVEASDGFQAELFFEKKENHLSLTVTREPGAESQVSEFFFDSEAMTITLEEDIFPGTDNTYENTYNIEILNENELVLFQGGAGAAKNSGWVWRFKRKGFRY